MNMIEVDPKLFIKCRLCLDETGQYQIVPNVQMQIKYCFDIDVEPFDGLPQLVCKKCESILSQYSGIKQIFQEKQKNLKTKLSSNENVKIDVILQQQQDTVSSTQAETENKNKIEGTTRYNRITPVPTRSSSTETVTSNLSQKRNSKTIVGKIPKNIWESSYTKHFVCRFCGIFFKDKKRISYHIQKQCKWYTKYSKINKKICLVALNKIGSKPNLTGSIENVVCNENKIIQSRQANYYYILYTNNSNDCCDSSDSSDEDFIFDKKKRKRRRLISRSSNETVVIDQSSGKRSDDEKFAKVRKSRKGKHTPIASDIECVDIEDSDSNSTKSIVKAKDIESETSQRDQTKTINDKMINNIIAMCSNKYMNKLNVSEGASTNRGREESSLKHKILSIGRKVIYGKGISTTGLLRYMEHKNLEVLWVPKMETKVTIRTRSRDSSEVDKSQFGWENITCIQNLIIQDFALVFEKNLTLEASIDENNEEYQGTQLNLLDHESLNQNENRESALIYFQKLKELETKSGGDNSNNDNVSDKSPTYIDSSETKVNDNNTYLRAVLDADRNWKKLLNANPVANPKQLPKKNSFNEPASIVKLYSNELKNDSESVENSNTENSNEILHMPIITSTVSLAPSVNIVEQPNVAYSNRNENGMNSVKNGPQSTMPKIKLKPVSELMSDEALNQQNKSSFVSTTGWTVNNENQRQNVVLQTNDSNMVYLANPPFTNVIPVQQDLVFYPQTQDIQAVGFKPTVNQLGSKQQQKDREYVKLHTVELPNTRTESPFRYFQKLLEMHNLILLDSILTLSNTMQCLTKFKVVFEQESNSPVKLCLLLYCQNNIFCIKAKDHLLKELDIAKFSANWQWEILKVFKGDDVVPKLLASASRFGGPIYNYTSYFTNLLRSIIFSKDS